MRHLVHMLAFALTAEPPPVEVINKCPPVFVVVNKIPAAPVVAVPDPFRNVRHEGHACPKCGYERQRTPITGWVGGSHQHTCPKCSATWIH